MGIETSVDEFYLLFDSVSTSNTSLVHSIHGDGMCVHRDFKHQADKAEIIPIKLATPSEVI